MRHSYSTIGEEINYFKISNIGSTNATVMFCMNGTATMNLQYCFEDENQWHPISVRMSIAVPSQQAILVRCNPDHIGSGWISADTSNYCYISLGSSAFAISGSLHTLNYLCSDIEARQSVSTLLYQYYRLLYGHTNLLHASGLKIFAKTIGNYSLDRMFGNCSNLITSPDIIAADSIGVGGCEYMFNNCHALTTVPELPAETIGSKGYMYMFNHCRSLITAHSILPAMSVGSQGYQQMYSNCTQLKSAPVLPALTMTILCYGYMFSRCTSLLSMPELPATKLANQCYTYMFRGCTFTQTSVLPELETPASKAFEYMFVDCKNLTSVTVRFTNVYSTMFNNWLSNVASTGVIYCDDSLQLTTNSASGIPSGWTRETITL